MRMRDKVIIDSRNRVKDGIAWPLAKRECSFIKGSHSVTIEMAGELCAPYFGSSQMPNT